MPELRDMLTPDVLAGLERFVAAQEEPVTIPQAVDMALRDWLIGQGLLACDEGEEDDVDFLPASRRWKPRGCR